MSDFQCQVVRVKIESHPNADAIEIARIGDYQSIVKKDQFKDGDFAVYIPEQAVLPEWLLKDMNFWDEGKQKGMLSGSKGNRVRAIKLCGVLSQGLIYQTRPYSETQVLVASTPVNGNYGAGIVEIGGDASECMGIVKYEPPLPSHMAGRCIGVDFGATHKYDFDNLKKMPTLFDDGEDVVITEKIHGTLIQIGVVPESAANDKYYKGRVIISSKDMGGKGYVLDHNDETNLYAQAAKKHGLLDKALEYGGPAANAHNKPVFLMGEVFGKAASGADVQDLTYAGETLDFRAFDICVGNRGSEEYFSFKDFATACRMIDVPSVPVLYIGPYSKDIVLELTDGNTTLSVNPQIREGVVVRSCKENRHPHFGRKIAKSVSEAYLLRKSGTEYN
jgi:RNA ligase (TIGR02306 family)